MYYYLYTADKCHWVDVTSCRRICNNNIIIVVIIIMTVSAECARRRGRMTIFLAEEVCGSRPRDYTIRTIIYYTYTVYFIKIYITGREVAAAAKPVRRNLEEKKMSNECTFQNEIALNHGNSVSFYITQKRISMSNQSV